MNVEECFNASVLRDKKNEVAEAVAKVLNEYRPGVMTGFDFSSYMIGDETLLLDPVYDAIQSFHTHQEPQLCSVSGCRNEWCRDFSDRLGFCSDHNDVADSHAARHRPDAPLFARTPMLLNVKDNTPYRHANAMEGEIWHIMKYLCPDETALMQTRRETTRENVKDLYISFKCPRCGSAKHLPHAYPYIGAICTSEDIEVFNRELAEVCLSKCPKAATVSSDENIEDEEIIETEDDEENIDEYDDYEEYDDYYQQDYDYSQEYEEPIRTHYRLHYYPRLIRVIIPVIVLIVLILIFILSRA